MPRDSGSSLLHAVGPFALTALAAWVAAPIGTQDVSWAQYGLSLGLLAAAWGYGLWASFHDRLWLGTVLGSLGFLTAVAVLRNSAGGSQSGVSIVSLLAVFQTALYVRDRRALLIVLVALLAFYVAPLLIVGPPAYPRSGYRSTLLVLAVSAIVGLVTHGLVANIRSRASAARRRERVLSRINETVNALYDSSNPRRDACLAVKDISEALVVGLFEPDPGSTALLLTTTTQPDVIDTGVAADPRSGLYQVFESGRQWLITEDVKDYVGSVELWQRAGAPSSLLYQPLIKRDETVGVMFVGWSETVEPDGPGVNAASLLAHEVAAVIERADVIVQLTGDALTDSLTGLPNRRAWDAELERRLRDRRNPIAVAMLDIDRFKQFNDTRGHPAGDRLLRDAAAAWRLEMRAGDFLARLGGEEFGLLITGADIATVQAIVHRLRTRMPEQQTCSAGIALRVEGDTPEALVSRADEALSEAKASGRDRTVFTDGAAPAA